MLVIVKGSRPEAISALCARGITEIISIEEQDRFHECWVRTPDHNQWKIIKWFCEGSFKAPFPPGTCLFYGNVGAASGAATREEGPAHA